MARKMLALVKEKGKITIRQVPMPVARNPGDVVVRVMKAGICRTDLLAASGQIETNPTLILGHEFSGIIESTSKSLRGFKEGDPVAVNPVGACKRCERCKNHDQINCLNPRFLGLRMDGGFAEFVRIAKTSLFKLPAKVPFIEGAYAEPVAAGLAVLKAGIRPSQRGMICGTNRIAVLIRRILAAHGFHAVDCIDISQADQVPEGRYDYAIETLPDPQHFRVILKAIRRRGKIILRSRVHPHVQFPLMAALGKEPVIQVVNYGSFQDAVDLLSSKAIDLSDLLGKRFLLGSFRQAFTDAQNSEANKVFFSIGRE